MKDRFSGMELKAEGRGRRRREIGQRNLHLFAGQRTMGYVFFRENSNPSMVEDGAMKG